MRCETASLTRVTKQRQKAASFRTLIRFLAEQVGRHQLPINDGACDIHELLGADAVHHDVIKRLVRLIYKANHCGHLDASVTPSATFNALGRIREELVSSRFTDIDQINLVDSIGDASKDWFRLSPQKDQDRNERLAEIIPLYRAG